MASVSAVEEGDWICEDGVERRDKKGKREDGMCSSGGVRCVDWRLGFGMGDWVRREGRQGRQGLSWIPRPGVVDCGYEFLISDVGCSGILSCGELTNS